MITTFVHFQMPLSPIYLFNLPIVISFTSLKFRMHQDNCYLKKYTQPCGLVHFAFMATNHKWGSQYCQVLLLCYFNEFAFALSNLAASCLSYRPTSSIQAEIDGKQWKQCKTLYFRGSKITADDDCSHEIKRCLLFGRKVMANLDSIFKSRDITLPTKVRLVKAMVFPVVTYGCESWTVKKAECGRIDAFELWCWRRLRVPWTARRSNQSILKEIRPGVHWKDWC